MKKFNPSDYSHVLVVRNLGIRKEIFIVSAKNAAYVISQAVYQYHMGTKTPNFKVYGLTSELFKKAKGHYDILSNGYPGMLEENIFSNNSDFVKKYIPELTEGIFNEIDLDSVLGYGERKDFYLVVMKSPMHPESSMTIYKSVAKRTAMALADNTPTTEEVMDSHNFKPEFKQIFAMFPNKEYIEVPAGTYEMFNKSVRPVVELISTEA